MNINIIRLRLSEFPPTQKGDFRAKRTQKGISPIARMASGSVLAKFAKPGFRPQSTDIQAAAMWGVAAVTTAVWIVQPFDWLKKTFFEKPAPEEGQ